MIFIQMACVLILDEIVNTHHHVRLTLNSDNTTWVRHFCDGGLCETGEQYAVCAAKSCTQ